MGSKAPSTDLATRAEQQEVVRDHRASRLLYNNAMDEHASKLILPIELGIDASNSAFVDSEAYRRARGAVATLADIEATYNRRLPRLTLGSCPICEKPLLRSFDPFGLDGLWWRSDAHADEPQPCPHFCVLVGAVDLAGTTPKPDFEVRPGPGAPFVIPRLLEQPGMVAVISEVAMADGAKAYPIAYFAPRRPPVQSLVASWARTNFVYTTQLGVNAWRRWDESPTGEPERWDFELGPWLSQKKVRWCDPGTDRSSLSGAPPEACPFIGLSGVKEPQLIPVAPLPLGRTLESDR